MRSLFITSTAVALLIGGTLFSVANAQTAAEPVQALPPAPSFNDGQPAHQAANPNQAMQQNANVDEDDEEATQQQQEPEWLYFVSYNDTDQLGDWVTDFCGTRDASGVKAFIAQQGDGMPYTVHLWCRQDRANVEWVRGGETWDGGSAEAVAVNLATGNVGLVGFIRHPMGDSVVWLQQTK